ncbi:MAG: PAS domain S-box protein [Deltaproteobacteria bacterium]|nr:PAS domain S-box protein [Deltaproteobacteria bacterium]
MTEDSVAVGKKMKDTPFYSSRILKNYIEFLRKNRPEVNIDNLLARAEITSYQIEDGGFWFTQNDIERFHDILLQETKDETIPREVGRYAPLSRSAGIVSQYALGFILPEIVYTLLEKITPHLDRGHIWKARKLEKNKIEVETIPKPGVIEKPYQCENRLGTLEGISMLFTSEYAHIEHPACIHKGGNSCVYIITMEQPPFFFWKRVRNFTSVIGLFLCIALFMVLPVIYWIPFTLCYALAVAFLSLYSMKLENTHLTENIKSHSDSADSLLNQINQMYRSAILIHEVGQTTSRMMESRTLLKHVMTVMEKRLDFDRGMIMLSNPESTRLIYSAGYGYNPEHEEYLSGIEFHLDNPLSRGPLKEAFQQQKPILVDDVTKIEDTLSQRSRDFAKRMGAKSFICVPIVFERESLGVLLVDNVRSKKMFSQSEINLLMGIATHVAISIKNAMSYQKILESEERFRSLSENAPDIIYTLDVKGAFMYINPAWSSILGHDHEEVIGRYFIDFVRKEDIKSFIQLFKQIRDEKRTLKNQIGIILHKDGSERFFNMSGAPNFDLEGNVVGAVGIFKDITESKKLASQFYQAQKMEAVGTLAGGIAHDFNNLLMGIQGYTSLMLFDTGSDHPHYEKLKRIEDQVMSAADLTRQLLGFARGGRYETRSTDLNELVERTTSMFERTKKEISIDRRYGENLWPTEVDRGQIEQVLLNLYVNAWQAMPGGGKIFVETTNVKLDGELVKPYGVREGRYVSLSVKDTGVGMDARTQERIFEPFFTTKEMSRGTGLGLASAYGIIKNHQGIITVDSEVGEGSTFTIYLPVSEQRVESEEEIVGKTVRGKETILLVDDEETVLEVTVKLLEVLGYRVLVARTGHEAVEVYRFLRNEIDLVILDMIMPGMGGEATFDILKFISPKVKVLLSSGYSVEGDSEKMLERGCHGFVQKPYNLEALSKKVREVLDRSN